MKLVDSAPQADIEAETVPDTGGVYCAMFTGLRYGICTPGIIAGITRGTKESMNPRRPGVYSLSKP